MKNKKELTQENFIKALNSRKGNFKDLPKDGNYKKNTENYLRKSI